MYAAFAVDGLSARITGWKAARTTQASLVVDALNMSSWTRRGVVLEGLIRRGVTASNG